MKRWRYLAATAVVVLALAVAACGGRDVGFGAEALVGHWQVEDMGTDFYFAGDGTFTRVDVGGTYPGTWIAVGDAAELAAIVQLDYAPEIEVLSDALLKLTFAPGYESLQTGDPAVVEGISLVWHYVDGKTAP